MKVIPETNILLVDTSELYTQQELDQAIEQASSNKYSQEEVDQLILNERSRWDADKDNHIGILEAIKALKVTVGE